MRCIKQPSINDKTINLGSRNWYDQEKPITIYYKAWGGDGGGGANGGGGGSSAILKNGQPIVTAAGADGNQKAKIVSGSFTVTKSDSIRFILGGGGGDGSASLTTYSVGGNGGAGYKGGGGGASATGRLAAVDASFAGKGGSASPGQGGFIPSSSTITGVGLPGSSAIDQNGGVSTYPDGSSAPVGAMSMVYGKAAYVSSISCSNTDYSVVQNISSKWPATPTMSGSGTLINTDGIYATLSFSGPGGSLGIGGGKPSATIPSSAYNCIWQNMSSRMHFSNTETDIYPQNYSNVYSPVCGNTRPENQTPNGNKTYCQARSFPLPEEDFKATRGIIESIYVGSLPGNIFIMYQAPTCELIPNHDEI